MNTRRAPDIVVSTTSPTSQHRRGRKTRAGGRVFYISTYSLRSGVSTSESGLWGGLSCRADRRSGRARTRQPPNHPRACSAAPTTRERVQLAHAGRDTASSIRRGRFVTGDSTGSAARRPRSGPLVDVRWPLTAERAVGDEATSGVRFRLHRRGLPEMSVTRHRGAQERRPGGLGAAADVPGCDRRPVHTGRAMRRAGRRVSQGGLRLFTGTTHCRTVDTSMTRDHQYQPSGGSSEMARRRRPSLAGRPPSGAGVVVPA